MPPGDKIERVRAYTRAIEFDFINWTMDAVLVKGAQAALGEQNYILDWKQSEIVKSYFQLVGSLYQIESEISRIYSDPDIADPKTVANDLLVDRNQIVKTLGEISPFCESILQQQINAVLAEMGFTLGGQSIPPLQYHVSPLPDGLVISPREVIRQDANILLNPGMPLENIIALEHQVEKGLGVSALVEGMGGVGVYPTMVMRSSDLTWFSDTVAHEWIHNFLSLRPLGLYYDVTPDLRTMNETTASIAGKEIGFAVLKKYYPEFLPPPPAPQSNKTDQTLQPIPEAKDFPPVFDYRAEMHQTRVYTDQLLLEGKIEAAESYMETRRKVFWGNGYQLRRLNQAYFAFHGAYADSPIGEAGTDPVGPAVRALRQQSSTLLEFVNRISWMTSFEKLTRAVYPNQ